MDQVTCRDLRERSPVPESTPNESGNSLEYLYESRTRTLSLFNGNLSTSVDIVKFFTMKILIRVKLFFFSTLGRRLECVRLFGQPSPTSLMAEKHCISDDYGACFELPTDSVACNSLWPMHRVCFEENERD